MTIPSSIREGAKLLAGIVLGAFGAVLFQRSLPPPADTPEAKIFAMEHQLKAAKQQIATLEDLHPNGSRKSGNSMMDEARRMAQDIRDGKTVNPDDIWRALKPIMRDISPLFDRIRQKDEARRIDWRVGEMGRKYDLTKEQQDALRGFFKTQSAENQKRWQDMLDDPNSDLLTMARASRKLRPDDGLDSFMEGTLQGEKLTEYKTTRMTQRAENVQRDADFKVERLHGIVPLEEEQKDKIFAIMARGSRDYDATMKLEGLGTDVTGLQPGDSTYQVVRGVLRPDQVRVLEQRQAERRQKAEKEFADYGMTMPKDWDMLEEGEMGWAD